LAKFNDSDILRLVFNGRRYPVKRKQFSDANAVVVAFANLNISSKFIEFINRWRWVDSARATVASEIIGDDEDQI